MSPAELGLAAAVAVIAVLVARRVLLRRWWRRRMGTGPFVVGLAGAFAAPVAAIGAFRALTGAEHAGLVLAVAGILFLFQVAVCAVLFRSLESARGGHVGSEPRR